MLNENDARELMGGDLYAADQSRVGKIGQIFLDDETGRPEWATVNTGFFGTSESFVPLEGAQRTSSGLTVDYTKDQIKNAPNVDPSGGHISGEQEEALYRHYGLSYVGGRGDVDHGDVTTAATTGTADTARVAHGTVEAEEGMVRSEEQVHVGKERVQTGRARLRKYVVTEQETITVPVRKEKVRLETEPLTDADRAAGTELIEGETEVTLSEERVVVAKEVVAKERVGLVKEVEEEQQTVTEDVRKERVEVEGDIDGTTGR